MYLLDTDTVSNFFRGQEPLTSNLLRVPESLLFLSSLTVYEYIQGHMAAINQAFRPHSRLDLEIVLRGLTDGITHLMHFRIAEYDAAADAIFRSFPPEVVRAGKVDCRIGAVARANDLIVVTANRRDFERIPGVRFEDWTVLR